MSDNTGEVEVTVEVEPQDDAAPETVVESSPTVIVESGGDEGTVTEDELNRAVEEAREQTALEIAVAGLIEGQDVILSRLTALEGSQEVVTDVVMDVAEEQAVMADALTEEVQESVGAGEDLDGDGEPDVAPQTARRHWLFRSLDEWRGK